MPKAWVGRLEVMLDKDEKETAQTSGLFVAETQTKIATITAKLQRLLDAYLDQTIDQDVYRIKQNALMSEKKTLEEQINKLTLGGSSWIESMRRWIKDASDLWKVVENYDLPAKKVRSKEIFGLNLILSNKQVQLKHSIFQKYLLEKHWTALCAAPSKCFR